MSTIARNVLRLVPGSQASQITCGHSIISAAHTTAKALRQKQRLRQFQTSIAANSSTVTEGTGEDLMKIDRIFYNVYGDIDSIVRRVRLYDTEHANDCVTRLDVRRTQNESIKHFFVDFVQQQPEGLIEALARLRALPNRADRRNHMAQSDIDSRLNDHLDGSELNDYLLNPSQNRHQGNSVSINWNVSDISGISDISRMEVDFNDAQNYDEFNVSRMDSESSRRNFNRSNDNVDGLRANDEVSIVGSTQESSVYSIQHITPVSYAQVSSLQSQRSTNKTSQQSQAGTHRSDISEISKIIRFGTSSFVAEPRTPENANPRRKFHFDVENLFSPELLRENVEQQRQHITATSEHNNSDSIDILMDETPAETDQIIGNSLFAGTSEILFNESPGEFKDFDQFSGGLRGESINFDQFSGGLLNESINFDQFSGGSLNESFCLSQSMATQMGFVPDQFSEIPSMHETNVNSQMSTLHTMDPMTAPQFDFQLEFPSSSNGPNDSQSTQFSAFKVPALTPSRAMSPDLFSNFSQSMWNQSPAKTLSGIKSLSRSSSQKRLQLERLKDFDSSSQSQGKSNPGIP